LTYTASAGPLGLQGRHTWNSTFTINDLAYGLPVAALDKITGLFSLPEMDDLRDPVVGGNGEVIYPTFTKGKTITYEGRLITIDGEGLYAYRWQMLNAFADQSNEHTMLITPHPSWGSGGWTYNARVLACDIDDEYLEQNLETLPSPYQLHFVLSVRMHNNVFTQV